MQFRIDQRISPFQFYSQLGQDLWVVLQTDHRQNGYFVDVGAANGIELSNTYALEKFLSWDGICIEPGNEIQQLRSNRSCAVDDSCVSGSSGEQIEFLPRGLYGGILPDRLRGRVPGTVLLETVSLEDLLQRHGAPRQIDFMSIDTEGVEFDILSNFDLDKYNVTLICIEHNGRREEIGKYLGRFGYTRFDHLDFTRQYYKHFVFAGKAELDHEHYPNSETGGDYDDWYIKAG